MTSADDWRRDLLEEKSLWSAYAKFLQIKPPKFNSLLRRFGYPVIFLIMIALSQCVLSSDDMLRALDTATASGLGISISVLGFLVAGITIFTTLSDRTILIELAKTPQKDCGISSFKYLFYNLLSVFVTYILAIAVLLSAQLVSSFRISVSDFNAFEYTLSSSSVLNCIGLSIVLIIIVEMLLKLKSFIWSVYSTFITMLVVADFMAETETGESSTDS